MSLRNRFSPRVYNPQYEQNQLAARAGLRIVGRDFAALPNNHLAAPTPGFILFNAVLDLLEGVSILWLYAAIRPRYGPGPKTAVIAAAAWWFVVTLGDATWCSFGFFPPSTVVPLMAGTLPAIILATLAGARFYRD
jgi:hypothetical protein